MEPCATKSAPPASCAPSSGTPDTYVATKVKDRRTLSLIPGRSDTLRINGRARVLSDADYFDAMAVNGKRPLLAFGIAVEEVFFQCTKAFLRSDAWRPETWNPPAVPSVSQIAKALIRTDVSMAELDAYYSATNMRNVLY
ncbi:hypothetical protein [Mycobacterium sp. IDR2000157661]|uniref:hypothetical protein n=1 Tax=Mycobacterium sp. IDR2000157661 TaxID=2867005 RepID=UPI00351D8B40